MKKEVLFCLLLVSSSCCCALEFMKYIPIEKLKIVFYLLPYSKNEQKTQIIQHDLKKENLEPCFLLMGSNAESGIEDGKKILNNLCYFFWYSLGFYRGCYHVKKDGLAALIRFND